MEPLHMDVERATEQLTERKVLRRGLIAGIAAFGAAAAMKVTGAGKAEATDGDALTIGQTKSAQSTTILDASLGISNPALQVLNGVGGFGPGRIGLIGAADGNTTSWGVLAYNGS